MEGVHEDVGAGVDLGDPLVRAGDVPGAETAGADDLGGEPVALERVGELEQLGDRWPAPSAIRSSRSGSSMQWPS